MPRTARIAPGDNIYHVLTRGNNRQNVFKDNADYERYKDILLKYKEKFCCKLYHYALMSNHTHLVIETQEGKGGLADIMKGINLSYAQYYKGRYRHIGHFWQDRYKSIIISKDEYLLACGSYVEVNPVRAKIVGDPRDYKWSSYSAYAYGKKDLLIDEHPIYEQLSNNELERRKKYREFVLGVLKEKEAMKGEMNRRVMYGNKDFTEKIAKNYKIEETIKPKGRPEKDENKNK